MIGSLSDSVLRLKKKFRSDVEFRELVIASFFSFAVRILGVGTGFLVTIVTARIYGADAYGTVSFCIAILTFASIIGKLGMDVSLMRYIAEFAEQKNFSSIKGIFLKAMKIIIPFCLLITIIIYFASHFLATQVFNKPHLENIIRYTSLLILPLVLLLITSECIRGLKKVRTYTFYQTAAVSSIAIILLLLATFFSTGKYIPVYVQFASISISALLVLFSWMRYSKFFSHEREHSVQSSNLVRTSSPMFITTLMQLLMSWAGTLILASYKSEADVGVYNAIVRISTFTNITILAINSISMPRFAGAYASGKMEELKQLSREASRLIFISSVPLFLVLFIFPQFILKILGKDFTGNEHALMLMLAGQLFVAFAGLPSQILNMTDREKILRSNAIFSAAINLGLCFWLIPLYGIMGACIAQVAGMIAWNTSCIYSVKQRLGFFTFFSFSFLMRKAEDK